MIIAALALGGCGARTGLDQERASNEAGHDAGARSDAGAAACDALRVIVPPFAVFDGPIGSRPIVAARRGGFDVVAGPLHDSFSYVARRYVLEGSTLALRSEAVIGPEARGVGSLAASGERLAFCYGAIDLEGPTRFVRTDALDYSGMVRGTVGMTGGDHCVGLAGSADRWLVAWNERSGSPFDYALAELDDRGAVVTDLVRVDAAPFDVVTLGDGFAYALRGPVPGRATIVFRAIGGEESRVELVGSSALGELRLVASPFAADALEVAWSTADGALGFARADRTGLAPLARLDPVAPLASGPHVAVLRSRVVAATAACAAIDDPGALSLRVVNRDRVGDPIDIERPTCPVFPDLAVDGATALVVWQEGERAMGAALGCAE